MRRRILSGLALLALALSLTWLIGRMRWERQTQELLDRMESSNVTEDLGRYDPAQVAALPEPVQRYLRAVLAEDAPRARRIRIRHQGSFNLSDDPRAARWVDFHSHQTVVTPRPGFVWDARVRMAPGTSVHVHDAYVGGEGILQASLFGLLSVAEQRGSRAMAEGELMRYLAEAVWYPTALLPGAGMRWEAIDARSARATLTDDGTRVSLVFGFDADALVRTVRSEARPRDVDGVLVPSPWEGRFSGYAERGGMRIPLDGEVAWELPEGRLPYWRGQIMDVAFDG